MTECHILPARKKGANQNGKTRVGVANGYAPSPRPRGGGDHRCSLSRQGHRPKTLAVALGALLVSASLNVKILSLSVGP